MADVSPVVNMTSIQKNLEIKKGKYTIGISKEIADEAYNKIGSGDIKLEFLYNCFPEHIVELNNCRLNNRFVTLSEFEKFIEDSEYITEAELDGWGWTWESRWIKKNALSWKSPFGNNADIIYFKHKDIIPVLQVSWNDASAYCKWLTEKGTAVRLPSELEWEIFAKKLEITGMRDVNPPYCRKTFGNMTDFIDAIVNLIIQKPEFHPPGIIWEWCSDWFNMYPGGMCNKEFGDVYKVLRGGSLLSHPIQSAREYRFRRCPTARSPFYGFRVLTSPSDEMFDGMSDEIDSSMTMMKKVKNRKRIIDYHQKGEARAAL